MSLDWRAYIPFDLRRRAMRLPAPGMQLKLPIYLLILTVGFAVLFAANSYVAWARIYEATVQTAAPEMESLIARQAQAYAITSGLLAAGFIMATVMTCVAYLHRVVGAATPMRRHVVALTEGDYSARIHLRKSDVAMSELAEELNELARTLELAEKRAD